MDKIASMFTNLKSAAMVGKKDTTVSYSKLNLAILEILKNKGFIKDFQEKKTANKKYPEGIIVSLSFKNKKEPKFNDMRRVSRPGRRIYLTNRKLNVIRRGKEEIIVSTSQGVMSGSDARRKGLGGEVIGEIV